MPLKKKINNLIEMQQAEIEGLRKTNDNLNDIIGDLLDDWTSAIEKAKSEAIKEFAEKFKKKAGSIVTSCQGYEIYETKQYQISAVNFDNLVKEMTEGE